MQNNTFTAEESVMIGLGLNPGLVENYAEVSLEPVSFEKEEGFCWGSRWTAVHDARYHNGGKIMGDGREFIVTKANPTFKTLLNAWREEQQKAG
ncbi:hypothetical protein AASM09_16180 [Stenotrophomonas maltophilia]|uniref:hypothetical protein n=1 Tax=Stenotrophomonas maltophilia TaxID=40324 RepID=UPI001D78859E|nr:hypothetical protein [Stenotrophomonas maltophilia]MCX3879758.1 hypothetical protein [Stenotrophomonas maltophilia]